jgi:hypothetical protein
VWHRVPFSEGAQYGIELFYPYDFELHFSTKDGHLNFEADWGEPPDGGAEWPPPGGRANSTVCSAEQRWLVGKADSAVLEFFGLSRTPRRGSVNQELSLADHSATGGA